MSQKEAEKKETRAQLVEYAISFLKDETVKDSPLTKKIEFLQTKGLTQQEIDYALKEAQKPSNEGSSLSNNEKNDQRSGKNKIEDYVYETLPPPLPQRDWKDYFVMATVSMGLIYGLMEVTKRYVLPNILPESKNKLEQDKDEIKAQFDKIDQILNAIEHEHNEFKQEEQKKLDELDTTIEQLENSLDDSRRAREKMDDDFRLLKLEMTTLQGSLDKFITNNNSVKEMESINEELLSLKNLIKNSSVFNRSQHTHSNNVTEASNNNNSFSEPLPDDVGVPGLDSIPTASELLAKFNNRNNNKNENSRSLQSVMNDSNSSDENSNIPAWKASRERTLQTMSQNTEDSTRQNSNNTEIPEWQKMLQGEDE